MHTVVIVTGDQRIPTIVTKDILWQVVFKLPKLLSERKKLYDSWFCLILPLEEIPVLLQDLGKLPDYKFVVIELQWAGKGLLWYQATILQQGVKVTIDEEKLPEQLWKTIWDLA